MRWLDQLKEHIRSIRPADEDGEGRFNFPKFHVLAHYVDFIKRFGTADGVDLSIGELEHKVLVKQYFMTVLINEKIFWGRSSNIISIQLLQHSHCRTILSSEKSLQSFSLRRATLSSV
jgi:hypothetical protein